MSKLKLKNKALNKMVKDVSGAYKQLENMATDKQLLEDRIEGIKNQMLSLEEKLKDFTSGVVKIDAKDYLTIQAEYRQLQEKLLQSETDLNSLNVLETELEDVLLNNVLDINIGDITAEYKENRYILINEMFCKMMEVVELSNQLTEESDLYRKTVKGTGHHKAHCYNFDTATSGIWNRFILNGFGVKYSQATTSKIQEFEVEYFNNKKK